MKKLRHTALGIVIFFILLTPISLYKEYKHIWLYGICQARHKWDGTQQCEGWRYADTLLALPILVIQNVTNIKFVWGDPPKTGAGVCDMLYEGLKIGSHPIYIAKKECVPI